MTLSECIDKALAAAGDKSEREILPFLDYLDKHYIGNAELERSIGLLRAQVLAFCVR